MRRFTRETRPASAEAVLLVVLAVWSLVPLVLLLLDSDGTFDGSDGLQVADHMQYMAFIRDSAEHWLVSNRFDVAPDPHLFLHPMYLLSGLAHRAGVSIQLAFLAWKPVGVVLLFLGFAAYVRRFLEPDRLAMAVALVLALFYISPATPLATWLGAGPHFRAGTLIVGLEMYAGSYVWGVSAGTIAVGLMPLFLLGVEKVLDESRRRPGRSARWYAIAAGLAGMLTSWLHPWQGLTLLGIAAGLVAWGRFQRRFVGLAVPVVLTALPLAYFQVLAHTHSSWNYVAQRNHFPHLGTWLLVTLAPAALALPGVPGRNLDLQERAIRLWPLAALAVYLSLRQSWFYHAFVGLSLPLSILAVRGWRRLHVPRVATPAVVAAVTLPGLVFALDQLLKERDDHFFKGGEAEALAYMDASPRAGPVLTPGRPLGEAVPAFAGRQTYVGHYYWTPYYDARVQQTNALFDGRLTPAQARRLVRASRAAFVASDCRRRADLRRALGRLVVKERRFGCATVYEIARE